MTAQRAVPSSAEIATERRNTGRVEAFSDGVIAIANLVMPLYSALARPWPQISG